MIRAPKPEPQEEEGVHTLTGYWQPSKWWQAVKGGELLVETSTPNSDDAFQAALNDGATAYQRIDFIPTECRWVQREPGVRYVPQALYDSLPEKSPGTIYYIREALL